MIRRGLCARCERRARLNRELFQGEREAVLIRDGYQCQNCGELDARLVLVHHRRKGARDRKYLLTLCRRCHVRVHRTFRPGFHFLANPLLRKLWREANPKLAEQRLLALLDDDKRWFQARLF